MTKHTIEMNFQQANRQATALEEQAEQMRNMANGNLDEIMQQLRASWTGDAANAYLAKCDQMRQYLLRTAYQLSNCAQSLRRAAQRLYNAEMTALRLAEERAVRG